MNSEDEDHDQDSVFEESEYNEDDEEYDEEEESEYSDSDVEGGDDDLSEEGLSWDELEKHALKEDRERLKRNGEDDPQPIKMKKRSKK